MKDRDDPDLDRELDPLEELPNAGRLATAVTSSALIIGGTPHGLLGIGLATFLGPYAADLLQGAVGEWRTQQQRKAGLLLNVGARKAGCTLEELLAKLQQDDARLALLGQAMQAAERTTVEDKVRCFGTALANGAFAEDDALIDEEHVFVTILSELEAPHIALLEYITHHSRPSGGDANSRTGVSEFELSEHRPGLSGFGNAPTLLQPLIRVLDRNGLIYQDGVGLIWDHNIADDIPEGAGTQRWAATKFGRYLLDRLRAAANFGDQDEP